MQGPCCHVVHTNCLSLFDDDLVFFSVFYAVTAAARQAVPFVVRQVRRIILVIEVIEIFVSKQVHPIDLAVPLIVCVIVVSQMEQVAVAVLDGSVGVKVEVHVHIADPFTLPDILVIFRLVPSRINPICA